MWFFLLLCTVTGLASNTMSKTMTVVDMQMAKRDALNVNYLSNGKDCGVLAVADYLEQNLEHEN